MVVIKRDGAYNGNRESYDFYPSHQLMQECQIHKKGNVPPEDQVLRRELQVGRIAEVSQIGVEQAQYILLCLVKTIVSHFILLLSFILFYLEF